MKGFQRTRSKFYFIVFIFFLLTILYSQAIASLSYYPTEGWQKTTPEQQGIESKMLADMMEEIQKNGRNIDSVLVVRNGYMVLDAYFYPFSKGQKHIIHSCTKSVMSALIGIAIEKGHIKSVNQPIIDFFPDKEIANLDELKESITLKNLLMMASGLECRDSYLYGWKGLFEMQKSGDWAQYVLGLPMAEPPGEKFEYCNGGSYLLSVIIQNTTKMKTLDFARENLFNPLGISEVGWRASPQGIDIGWGEMWLKPHDMAKIGLLYLNKGRWDQSQIVPASWIDESTRGYIDATLFDRYGYQWWVDVDGIYMAVGYKGQFIFVVPEKEIVVVFTSDLSNDNFYIPKNLLDNYIIPATTESKSLPPNSEETARLDNLANSVATASPDGFVWLSKEEGEAKDGVFKRTQSPKFNFEYPAGSKKLSTNSPDQIMRMKTLGDVHFSAAVSDIPENISLEDFGPKVYASALKNVGSNIKVIANNSMTLRCGAKAYRTDIKWLWNNQLELTTLVVSSYKDNKCVFLATHHPMLNAEKFAPIVESLSFKQITASGALPISEPGLYVNKEYNFSATYPEAWQERAGANPAALFFVKAPSNLPNLGVYVFPSGAVKLEDLPIRTTKLWANMYPHTKDHKVLSERMITLDCGTPAIEFVIDWNWSIDSGSQFINIQTVCVVAKKNENFVWLDSTNFSNLPIDINKKVTNSLRFYY